MHQNEIFEASSDTSSVNSDSENDFRKHSTVIDLLRKLYYLINDHDAGADDELIYVFHPRNIICIN